ncbi:HEXXH motif domain-containing protein [Streptomyces sp. NRRL S-340]|uniref:HEXXH motif domain-containing protein n=1 Tax=Streptomyces sp. NRRL S-340 TaxID=1463901 RepID=UPI00056A782E|nr:HEXXH motif domain-containing protein [Streptomyces sp. NRRL S-340]
MTHDHRADAPAPPLPLPGGLWHQLARGTPDGATVRLLRTARASRNLLLLRALHEDPRGGPGRARAVALLAAVRHRAPAVFDDLITDPAAGTALAEAVRAGRPGPVGALAVAAGHRAGLTFRLDVPVHDGTLRLPGLGRAALAPHARAAHVAGGPQGTTVTAHGPGTTVTVTVPDAPGRTAPGWAPLPHLTLAGPGPRLRLRLDSHPSLDDPGPPPAGELARWRERLGAAWRHLAARHPDRADAVRGTVRAVVPLPPRAPAGTSGRWLSASFSDAYGLVALAPLDDPAELAAALVHETQHSLLYALQDLTRLLDAPPGARGHAPWSERPRPPSALLQGASAFLVTAAFWRTEAALGDRAAHAPYERWRRTVRRAADELERGGWLTENGHLLLRALRDVLAEWDDAPP